MTRRLAIFLTPTIGFFLVWMVSRRADPLATFPRVILVAPERTEDLRFLQPDAAGVAFVARTIHLGSAAVTSEPRQQPLQFPQGTKLMAIMRLVGDGTPDRVSVIRELLTVRDLPRVSALRIDFEPQPAQRDWYAALLMDTRRALPSGFPLVISDASRLFISSPQAWTKESYEAAVRSLSK